MGRDAPAGDGPVTGERAALEALRDAALALLGLEADADLVDGAIAPVRARALALYRDYVARFGPLNRGELREGRIDPRTGRPSLQWHRPPLGGFRRDPGCHTVMALEVYDQATGSAGPAPILLRRVHGRLGTAGEPTTPFEALVMARAEGALDLGRIAVRLGLSGRGRGRAGAG